MGKNAAQVAQEISGRKSQNKTKKRVEEQEEIVGGIEDETAPNPVVAILDGDTKTGTPYDLVDGRPNIDYWGPLPGYQFVQTNHGEYAIPVGKILRFTYKDQWDPKLGETVTRAYPTYEDAPQALIDYVIPDKVAS